MKRTTIPTSKTETFTTAADGQSAVEVHVLQGERGMAADNQSVGRFNLDGILPAPRGVPQIEVSFDIDADGIVKVSAKDLGTGKEQHITITGRSGLRDDQVQNLLREAEQHSEEDRARREAVETRNAAESSVYAAEKLLKEQGDKAPAEIKSQIETKVQAVKDLLGQESVETGALISATNELQQSLQQLGQAVYGAGQAAAGGAPGGEAGGAEPGAEGGDEGDTVEGEFREV